MLSDVKKQKINKYRENLDCLCRGYFFKAVGLDCQSAVIKQTRHGVGAVICLIVQVKDRMVLLCSLVIVCYVAQGCLEHGRL